MPADDAGSAYLALVESQLKEERDRKASLEQRAIAVITTSGAIVTLTFGFTALVTNGFNPNAFVKVALTVALVLFAVAAGLGVWANRPLDYREADAAALRGLFRKKGDWTNDSPEEARRQTALVECKILAAARDLNRDKAFNLRRAIRTEVAAIVILGLAGVLIFWSGSTPAATAKPTPSPTVSP